MALTVTHMHRPTSNLNQGMRVVIGISEHGQLPLSVFTKANELQFCKPLLPSISEHLTRAMTTLPGCGTAPWALCPTTSTVDLCSPNEQTNTSHAPNKRNSETLPSHPYLVVGGRCGRHDAAAPGDRRAHRATVGVGATSGREG